MLTIAYYQIVNAWRIKGGKPHLKLMNGVSFFGVMLILLAVISTLFYINRDEEFRAYQKCQANILQHNIVVQQDTRARNLASARATRNYIAQFQRLVHRGQAKHAKASEIIRAFDESANTAKAKLDTVIAKPGKLQYITQCGPIK
jgi:biopolymer transport protein ExbB/TolQ